MLDALEVVTTVVIGLMVGVEFSVAFVINPILNALPDDSVVLGRAHGGRMLGAVMPVWYITSLVLVGVWVVAGRQGDGTGLVVTAGGLLIVSVIMSLLLLVPINNRGRTWTPENRPEDWKAQMNRWDRFHYARVAVIVAAFTCWWRPSPEPMGLPTRPIRRNPRPYSYVPDKRSLVVAALPWSGRRSVIYRISKGRERL